MDEIGLIELEDARGFGTCGDGLANCWAADRGGTGSAGLVAGGAGGGVLAGGVSPFFLVTWMVAAFNAADKILVIWAGFLSIKVTNGNPWIPAFFAAWFTWAMVIASACVRIWVVVSLSYILRSLVRRISSF
ncbi:hypothetical protein OGAPHI_001653 [Ogataea philodendri]|uniref:Uncharacterized protein n=1 Tax=Ogataea philodendri TaxID=1378263 RepID=A0A9P8PD17_9ASCO|nr:uncharacterized protein OGAPHI_001653 [Ogataea philodendri]KAH3669057.1 hypothetical protein OGAPHI_001653 [Ogataea philodendri]